MFVQFRFCSACDIKDIKKRDETPMVGLPYHYKEEVNISIYSDSVTENRFTDREYIWFKKIIIILKFRRWISENRRILRIILIKSWK